MLFISQIFCVSVFWTCVSNLLDPYGGLYYSTSSAYNWACMYCWNANSNSQYVKGGKKDPKAGAIAQAELKKKLEKAQLSWTRRRSELLKKKKENNEKKKKVPVKHV
eukprot:NODE_693_length_4690_cov_0.933130.p3 type:complete len:107 gc:universal NODE_693_length_4690_cov_0.933130:2800-2480(-)